MAAWIDLQIIANFETGFIRKRGIQIQINRGHVGLSEETLSERWKWSRGKVRRFLKELENRGLIIRKTVQQNPRLTLLIHLLNYEQEQGDETTERQETDNKQYRNKNKKKGKNKKNIYVKDSQVSLDYLGQVSDLKIPTNKRNEFYEVSEDQIQEWIKHYPAVDVRQEIREMISWANANPPKRKTCNGMGRFIVGWLAREQDKGDRRNGRGKEEISRRDPTCRSDGQPWPTGEVF